MAKKITLRTAMKEMAAGSKQAFHTFYTGTAQYVYQSAFYLYADDRLSRDFMVDFYQYLYLHLPEYNESQPVEDWISALVRQRFGELSIGKTVPAATLQQRMQTQTLTPQLQKQIWQLLESRISFPPEKKKHSYLFLALLAAVAALAVLICYHYKDTWFAAPEKKLDASDLVTEDPASNDETQSEEETDESDTSDSSLSLDPADTQSQSDDTDELTEQLTNGMNSSSQKDNQTTSKTDSQNQSEADQHTQPSAPEVTEPTVEEPTVNHPTVNHPSADSQSKSDSTKSDSSSGSESLEDLELNLHYGDSLTNRGLLSDSQ